MKTVLAQKTGFYGGALQFAGSRFEVDDEVKADWFDDLNPPAEAEPSAPNTSRKKANEKAAVT